MEHEVEKLLLFFCAGEKPLHCALCQQSFRTTRALAKHRKSIGHCRRTGRVKLDRHLCSHCGKVYLRFVYILWICILFEGWLLQFLFSLRDVCYTLFSFWEISHKFIFEVSLTCYLVFEGCVLLIIFFLRCLLNFILSLRDVSYTLTSLLEMSLTLYPLW